MAWTVERITELCKEYCGRCGIKFNSPVVINDRLTRTLGRCFCEGHGSVWNPVKIEISRQLLETATDESIEAVIAHECAHYVSCAITHENHGHDSTFRFYCEKIGTTNDTAVYSDLERKKETKKSINILFIALAAGNLLQANPVLIALLKSLGIFLVNAVMQKLR